MIRRPPRSTLCPDTTLCRSLQSAPLEPRADVVTVPEQEVRAGRVRHDVDDLRQVDDDDPLSGGQDVVRAEVAVRDRKSTRLNSSHANISYAVFCLKKKNRLV